MALPFRWVRRGDLASGGSVSTQVARRGVRG
jgi:hypothetical protein